MDQPERTVTGNALIELVGYAGAAAALVEIRSVRGLWAAGVGAAECAPRLPSVYGVIDPRHRPTVRAFRCLELTVTDSTSIMGGD